METITTTTAAETTMFLPEAGLPWLRTDPTMQHREAFEGTKLLTLHQDFGLMGQHYPGDTQLLITRVDGPADLVPGAVYLFEESNPGPALLRRFQGSDFARLREVDRVHDRLTVKRGRFAELRLTYDNPGDQQLPVAFPDNSFQWMVHFDGYRSPFMREAYPDYQSALWRVSHYVNPPTSAYAALANDDMLRMGMTPQQRQWCDDEKALMAGRGELVTVLTPGFDYPAELEQLLDTHRAGQMDYFLGTLLLLTPGQLKKRKAPAVTIHRRTAAGTVTRYYDQKAVAPLLDLLLAVQRERAAYKTLLSESARRQVDKEVAAIQRRRAAQQVPTTEQATTEQATTEQTNHLGTLDAQPLAAAA